MYNCGQTNEDRMEIPMRNLIEAKHDLVRLILTGAAMTILLCALSLPADAQWLNYPTAGIPRMADGKPNLSGPAPRTPDGKPDFSGVWMPDDQKFFQNLAAGLKPEDVPFKSICVPGKFLFRITRKSGFVRLRGRISAQPLRKTAFDSPTLWNLDGRGRPSESRRRDART
jgi:hypothetical protein